MRESLSREKAELQNGTARHDIEAQRNVNSLVKPTSSVLEAQGNTSPNNPNEAKIGLAFSGGGIRSAALSSGVLRRLLHRGVDVDCISCVSGGNFTAASYVDWKYHKGNKDDPVWHKEYFEQMRSNVGYICNWQVTWKGALETLLMVVLLLIVNIAIPFAVWGSFSIPVAYMVDLAFGDVMRIGFNCSQISRSNKNITSCGCELDYHDPEIKKPTTLFACLIIAFVVLVIVKGLVPIAHCFKVFFLEFLSGILLAFVFIPWLIQQIDESLPQYLKYAIIILSVFFWLGFPLLRTKASLALVFYFYAFVTRWRVYKGSIAGREYTEPDFIRLLLVSGILIWASPFLGMFSNTAIFTFFKWRLQKAFFHGGNPGSCGCQGISCHDFFPILSFRCNCHKTDPDSPHPRDAPTMNDMRNVKPEYISNVTVDYWREAPDKPPYGLISFSPKRVERIDCQPGEHGLHNTLRPQNVKVADAMTISASVVSPTEANDDPFRDLQILLGLAIRKNMRSDHSESDKRTLVNKVGPLFLQSFVALPLVILPLAYFGEGYTLAVEYFTMTIFGVYVCFFTFIACLPEWKRLWRPLYRFVRWCHVHLYHVRFIRELLRITKRGSDPPALLTLSDAGRLEKYGLIPLLKRRLPKIVVVDGSFIRDDKDYAKYLLKSLERAREMLGCEFVGYGGRDVFGEIQKKYVQPYPGKEKYQRSYRFLVHYFQEGDPYTPASSGEVLIIAPRHPNDGVEFPKDLDATWDQFTRDTSLRLDEKNWGADVVLKPEEADRLTFCCCECCHSRLSYIQKASRALCSGFPSHWTANQFFTPSQFTAYHREGYRACVEAGVEEFLNAEFPDGPGNEHSISIHV